MKPETKISFQSQFSVSEKTRYNSLQLANQNLKINQY